MRVSPENSFGNTLLKAEKEKPVGAPNALIIAQEE
jgi:hypothetical protein